MQRTPLATANRLKTLMPTARHPNESRTIIVHRGIVSDLWSLVGDVCVPCWRALGRSAYQIHFRPLRQSYFAEKGNDVSQHRGEPPTEAPLIQTHYLELAPALPCPAVSIAHASILTGHRHIHSTRLAAATAATTATTTTTRAGNAASTYLRGLGTGSYRSGHEVKVLNYTEALRAGREIRARPKGLRFAFVENWRNAHHVCRRRDIRPGRSAARNMELGCMQTIHIFKCGKQ